MEKSQTLAGSLAQQPVSVRSGSLVRIGWGERLTPDAQTYGMIKPCANIARKRLAGFRHLMAPDRPRLSIEGETIEGQKLAPSHNDTDTVGNYTRVPGTSAIQLVRTYVMEISSMEHGHDKSKYE